MKSDEFNKKLRQFKYYSKKLGYNYSFQKINDNYYIESSHYEILADVKLIFEMIEIYYKDFKTWYKDTLHNRKNIEYYLNYMFNITM